LQMANPPSSRTAAALQAAWTAIPPRYRSRSFAIGQGSKNKDAVSCTSPGMKAAILGDIEKQKQKITITKIVPVLRDIRTRSGPQPYPEAMARVVNQPGCLQAAPQRRARHRPLPRGRRVRQDPGLLGGGDRSGGNPELQKLLGLGEGRTGGGGETLLHVEGTPEGTVPQAYEPDANFDQAITLAYGDIPSSCGPARSRKLPTRPRSSSSTPSRTTWRTSRLYGLLPGVQPLQG